MKIFYFFKVSSNPINLHSSMVGLWSRHDRDFKSERFVFTFQYGWIMKYTKPALYCISNIFTFQYGWIMKSLYHVKLTSCILIYIPVWLDYEASNIDVTTSPDAYLHSSMVGLWRVFKWTINLNEQRFTFQYGWIMKFSAIPLLSISSTIYIPVWLDYEASQLSKARDLLNDLHSSMVGLWSLL